MNKVILMGRLARDPELRYTPTNSTAFVKFALAVDRRFVRQGEERKTDFINITAWGKTAEFCAKYFQKGRRAAVYGRIETNSWEDNDGNRRYSTEVIAEEMYFTDDKKDAYDSSQSNSSQSNSPQKEMPFDQKSDSKQSDDPDDFFSDDDDDNDVPF